MSDRSSLGGAAWRGAVLRGGAARRCCAAVLRGGAGTSGAGRGVPTRRGAPALPRNVVPTHADIGSPATTGRLIANGIIVNSLNKRILEGKTGAALEVFRVCATHIASFFWLLLRPET